MIISDDHLLDLGTDEHFDLDAPRRSTAIVIPSQGTRDPNDPLWREREHAYEHRHALMTGPWDKPGVLVSRKQFPPSEWEYMQRVFQNNGVSLPEVLVAAFDLEHINMPLDQILVANRDDMRRLFRAVERVSDIYGERPKMEVFNPTMFSERIARELGLELMANPGFANWAGSKVGLVDFLKECEVPTPLSFRLTTLKDVLPALQQIKKAGYPEVVVKMKFSTGGMGNKVTPIDEAINYCKDGNIAELFPEGRGRIDAGAAVVQGWIPGARSLSVGFYVNSDLAVELTSMQEHILSEDKEHHSVGAVGAIPLELKYKEALLYEALKIANGYTRHNATGPHTMGFIAPPDEWADKLGIPRNAVLAVDENTRPGSTTMALSYAVALRGGPQNLGTGWAVSSIRVHGKMAFEEVLERLTAEGLLIDSPSKLGEGIYPYGGLILHTGNGHSKFLAISLAGNAARAREILDEVKRKFSES